MSFFISLIHSTLNPFICKNWKQLNNNNNIDNNNDNNNNNNNKETDYHWIFIHVVSFLSRTENNKSSYTLQLGLFEIVDNKQLPQSYTMLCSWVIIDYHSAEYWYFKMVLQLEASANLFDQD